MGANDIDFSGMVIAGRYRLEGPIDKGGQGEVYRAIDLREGDRVAIKLLKPSSAHDVECRERMLREARALCALGGTAAVRVLDQRWTDQNVPCLVMELLEGHDFDDELRRREAQGRRMMPAELVSLLEPVVSTLQRAHELNILHRDIKPANLFLTDHHGVRLVDFGFAKFTLLPGLTAAGMVPGSPSYMAPEAWATRALDGRADVYSLGVLIFRALAGRVPFEHRNMLDLWREVTTAERPSLHRLRADLPADLDLWVKQALAIDPAQRFLRVGAMWRAFRSVAGV